MLLIQHRGKMHVPSIVSSTKLSHPLFCLGYRERGSSLFDFKKEAAPLYRPWCGWLRSCWIASFLASRKSARAWRGELSSSSMMAHRASATAWSDTL